MICPRLMRPTGENRIRHGVSDPAASSDFVTYDRWQVLEIQPIQINGLFQFHILLSDSVCPPEDCHLLVAARAGPKPGTGEATQCQWLSRAGDRLALSGPGVSTLVCNDASRAAGALVALPACGAT